MVVVDRLMAPKVSRSESPAPVTVSLHCTGDFADGTKLRALKWGDYAGCLGWAQCDVRVLIRGRQEGSVRKRYDHESRGWRDALGERGCEPQNAGGV